MAAILIIDDEKSYRERFSIIASDMGHKVASAQTLKGGIKELESGHFEVVFLDTQLPDGKGVDAIPDICQKSSSPEVILLTDFRSVEEAQVAINNGAWSYINKSSTLNEINSLLININRYLEGKKPRVDSDPSYRKYLKDIVGSSPQIRLCKSLLVNVARTDFNVLIQGETGTGKELFARAIHNCSKRVDKNFVVVDCTAIPEDLVESVLYGYERGSYTGAVKSHDGLVKQADGGTLFLDEVGELPLSLQKSFLRVIQEHRFRPLGYKQEVKSDFRLIAASHRDLEPMVSQRLFREDLLFRLRSFTIEAPPLRRRLQDLKELVLYYMPLLCKQSGIGEKRLDAGFVNALGLYTWPGNVRELIHVLESSLLEAGDQRVLFDKHLPNYMRVWLARSLITKEVAAGDDTPGIPSSRVFPKLNAVRESAVDRAEQQYLKDLVSLTQGDIREACRISGLSRTRLYVLLKKHKIAIHPH